jgi:hypothetical protein
MGPEDQGTYDLEHKTGTRNRNGIARKGTEDSPTRDKEYKDWDRRQMKSDRRRGKGNIRG